MIAAIAIAVSVAGIAVAGIAVAGIAVAGIAVAKKTCLLRVFGWIEDFMSGYCNRPNYFKISIF